MNSTRLALVVVALVAASIGIGIWAGKRAQPAPAALRPAAVALERDAAGAALPDYLRAVWNPLHFRPAIETARDEQCLACHREVLEDRVLAKSPAGLEATRVKAWYQELATYAADQETFHRRHLATPFAQRVMNLRCNTCHEGQNPREEAPVPPTYGDAGFTLRKQVNPAKSCLKCHGQMDWKLMGLPAPWAESKTTFAGSCLTCHAGIRTNRHSKSQLPQDRGDRGGRPADFRLLLRLPRRKAVVPDRLSLSAPRLGGHVGEAREKIAAELAGTAPIVEVEEMGEAVRRSARLAQPGDVVLLSPACASFDQYASYAERGRHFQSEVNAL